MCMYVCIYTVNIYAKTWHLSQKNVSNRHQQAETTASTIVVHATDTSNWLQRKKLNRNINPR